MKRTFSITLVLLLLLTGCNSSKKEIANLEKQMNEAMAKLAKEYNDDDSDIKAEFIDGDESLELSWNGKTMTASYDLHFKDLLSDNPTSYADGLLISMVVYQDGIERVTRMEFTYKGVSFHTIPFTSNKIGEKGMAVAGFSVNDESTRECLYLLSNLAAEVEGKICTNKGSIEIPLGDILGLAGFVQSYITNGGELEPPK